MKIQYDKDFEKVMNELQANFGWSNIDELPDSYKDLLNDTIKAVKNCSIPAVIKSVCDDCTAYPFDERGKTPLCKNCKDNPSQTVL